MRKTFYSFLIAGLLVACSSVSFGADKKAFAKRSPANDSASSEELVGASCKGLASNYDLTFSIVDKSVKGEMSATLGAGSDGKYDVTYNLDGTKAKLTVIDTMNSNSLISLVPADAKNTMYFYCTKK